MLSCWQLELVRGGGLLCQLVVVPLALGFIFPFWLHHKALLLSHLRDSLGSSE